MEYAVQITPSARTPKYLVYLAALDPWDAAIKATIAAEGYGTPGTVKVYPGTIFSPSLHKPLATFQARQGQKPFGR